MIIMGQVHEAIISLATCSEATSSFIRLSLFSRCTFSVPLLPQMHECPPALHSTVPPSIHLLLLSSISPPPLPSGSATDPHKILGHGRFSVLSSILCVLQFIAQLSALRLVSVCAQVRLNAFLHFLFCSLTHFFKFS